MHIGTSIIIENGNEAKMIDIHCHVLPDVDDGAGDIIESLEMLRIAAESDITDVIATPHCAPGMFNNYNDSTLDEVFTLLSLAAQEEHINVNIHRGMEVYFDSNTAENFTSGRVLTLGGSRYILIECNFFTMPKNMNDALRMLIDGGFRPIVLIPNDTALFNRDPPLRLTGSRWVACCN